MKLHFQCAEQAMSTSNLSKYCACHEILKFKIAAETLWIASANRKTIRRHSDDIPTIIRAWNRHLAPAASETLLVPSWRRILYGKIQHFALRLSPKKSPNAAPATKSDNPTSPNTAPATQNESHDWCASHMKRHFQCAEQAMSTSNLSKYCACHEIFKFKISAETPWIASAYRKTIRRHSDDIPTIIRAWNRHLAPAASETLLVPSWRRILYGKIQHFALRLSPKMSPNAAPATKSHTPTSPNTAPATQNASHDWSASHMKRHLECAEQAKSTSNLSKYCACHEICKFKTSAETPWIASANRKTIRG